jgi:hypothetical protein
VRIEQLGDYMVEYQKWNPDADVEECRALRENVELLIQEKLRKYPKVIKQIDSCELTVKDGQEHVYVVAVGEIP